MLLPTTSQINYITSCIGSYEQILCADTLLTNLVIPKGPITRVDFICVSKGSSIRNVHSLEGRIYLLHT